MYDAGWSPVFRSRKWAQRVWLVASTANGACFPPECDGARLPLDVDYVAAGNAQIQLFQANYPNSKQVSAPVEARDELVIGGTSWRYLRLSFPQASGTPLVVHFAERSFDGDTYVSVGLDSRGDLVAEKAQLVEIIASLH